MIGAAYKLSSSGKIVYQARRWRHHIWRGGEKSISDAMREGKDGWAFDHDHLLQMKHKGVELVMVTERDVGGNSYLTTLENCMNPLCYRMGNFESRGGALQHYVAMKWFHLIPGKMKF